MDGTHNLTDCPACGYKDPFMRSWYDPSSETAEPIYFKDWRPDMYDLLQKQDIIEGKFHYHMTFKKGPQHLPSSIYRWNVEIDRVGRGVQEGGRRKNNHLRSKTARARQSKLTLTE